MAIKNIGLIIVVSGILFTTENCNRHCLVASGTTISLTGGNSLYSPVKDSMKTGDTLFLNINIPGRLTYSNTTQTIDFSNATNMKADIRFIALKGVQSKSAALDSFLFIKKVGEYSANPLLPDASIGITFKEEANNYLFLIGCVPQKKGVYMIAISDIPYANKNCDYASIAIVSKSSDSHLHYLKDIYYGGGPIDPIDSTHSYCFKVY